ncbi:MAG: NAD(P)-binding domain-containing protein [Patescibacteria group bacterium]
MIKRVGLIGLSTMGQNLAKNFAENGIDVVVYNRTPDKTDLLKNVKNILTTYSIAEFISELGEFQVILLLVKAGEPTDEVLASLEQYKNKESVIVDLGNANYLDSLRRTQSITNYYVCGISGGEEGARNGASLMLSGPEQNATLLIELFSKVAAYDFKKGKTISYLGQSVEGNVVKTIHNGIEYIQMQILSEIYSLLKYIKGQDNEVISSIFEEWSKQKTDYMLEMMAKVIKNQKILDSTLPKVDSKGTGKWSAQLALEKETYSTNLNLVYNLRKIENEILFLPQNLDCSIEKLSDLYDQAFTHALLEGLEVIHSFSSLIDLNEVRRVWQGGCIIRNSSLASKKNYDYARYIKLFSPLRLFDVPLPVLSNMYQNSLIGVYGLPGSPLIACTRDVFGKHGFYNLSGEKISFNW